ncbi:MAG: DNA primase [Ruminococcaceae bacterium]|nr:DNA primase [Oscillospiraceae bacterium]
MISASVIEDLKFRNSIEDVISSYVSLSRAGSNLKGLCPFHSEKSPSFTVYTGDGHYYCFGCGAGGDVITFIMRMENLDYRAALEFLAKRAGVTLPDDDKGDKKGVSRSRILEMNKLAARFFHKALYSDEGAEARTYLMNRKLTGSTVKHFGLGYAPNSYDSLKNYLKSKGYTDEEMVSAFLCARSKKNEKHTYDVFRNKVMFPIIDVSGNVVAFGARVLDDSKPKYINTSDTPAFKKHRNLFGLNFAKNSKEDYLILCEGYMDVISLHAAGFTNAVAALGTAFNAETARLLKKYTDKVCLCFDSDGAGQNATNRALQTLSELDISVRVVKVPGEKDPDDFIKAYGAEEFRRVLDSGQTPFDYKIYKILSKYNVENTDEKVRAARELCYIIADIPSKVERGIYVQKASKLLEIDAEGIKADIRSILRRKENERKKKDRDELIRSTARLGDRVDPDFAKEKKSGALESTVLGLMLYRGELVDTDREKELLSPEMFFSELNRRLYVKIKECHEAGGFDFAMLGESFSPEEISKAEQMVAKRRELTNNSESAFLDAAAALKAEAEKIRQREEGWDISSLLERRRNENKNN